MGALDATDAGPAQLGPDDPNSGAYEQLLGDSAPLGATADSGSSIPENGMAIAGTDDGFSIIDPQVEVSGLDANADLPSESAFLDDAPKHNWSDIAGSALLGSSVGVGTTALFTHRDQVRDSLQHLKISLSEGGQLSKAMTFGLPNATAAEGTTAKASAFASQAGRLAIKGLKFIK